MKLIFVAFTRISLIFIVCSACHDLAFEPPRAGSTLCRPIENVEPIRVVILGDRTGHPNDIHFAEILSESQKLRPDLLLSMGDLIDGYQPDDIMDEAVAEWDHVLKKIHRVYGNTPFYATPGNHDVWSEQSLALFEQVMGHTVNHAFDVGSARVIILDTSQIYSESEVPEETLNWLWQQLRDAKDKKERIVLTHRPLWAMSPGGKYGSPLHDVFIAGDVTWVFTAHWHHTMQDFRDGINYQLIGPSGASPNRPGHPESGNFQQFGLLVIDHEGAEFSVVRGGGIMDHDAIPYSANQLEYRITNRAVTTPRFELSGVKPSSNGVLRLLVNNVTEEQLKSEISFESDDRWLITPSSRVVDLAPGDADELLFRYTLKRGALFPGPRISIDFPWPGDLKYRLGKTLPPTLLATVAANDTSPQVDGELLEPIWKKTQQIGAFGQSKGTGIQGETIIQLALSQNTLFVGATVYEEDMAGMTANIIERDEYVEDEDHLVIFIKPDPTQKPYARVAINAAGTVQDRLMATGESQESEMAWNGVTTAAVKRFEDYWTMELAIPLKEMGWDGKTSRIGFNIWRGRVRDHETSRVFWQPLLEHNNDSFGLAVLPL